MPTTLKFVVDKTLVWYGKYLKSIVILKSVEEEGPSDS